VGVSETKPGQSRDRDKAGTDGVTPKANPSKCKTAHPDGLQQIAATGYLSLVGIFYAKGSSFFPRIEFCADEPPRKL
jgi:hypothetical protein